MIQASLSDSLKAILHEHSLRELPREACGFLIGWREGERMHIEGVEPAINRRADLPDRFEIGAADYLEALTAAQDRGFEVMGFYHSHPGGSLQLSRMDRLHAWPDHLYIIVALPLRSPGAQPSSRAAFQGWIREAGRDDFTPIPL